MGKYKWDLKVKVEPEIDILDFIDSAENSNLLDEMPPLPTLTTEEINSVIPSFATNNDLDLLENLFECKPKVVLPIDEDEFSEARVLQVTNYQDDNSNPSMDGVALTIKQNISQGIRTQMADDEEPDEIPYGERYVCKPSLFNRKRPSEKYPWELDFATETDTVAAPADDANGENDNNDFVGDKSIELIGDYEENETYKRLKIIFDAAESQPIAIPSWIRRHYRKLCVRRMQRSVGLPVFNVDRFSKNDFLLSSRSAAAASAILDRFHHLISASGNFSSGEKVNDSFMARLAGTCQYDFFISPHTERVLHPFIYRNLNCVPTWVQLMCELKYVVNDKIPSRASVDYCYLRPQHIAAVNGLLQRMFWPGIDSEFYRSLCFSFSHHFTDYFYLLTVSECLSYPDFTVVALYKKLVIGCAFLVPDVGDNEAYVSFMAVRPDWQRAGIATFMLYHLTQTCIGKDITLHVSATNPAICLYQKFGFKIQELILDFYEKYLPYDSSQSRHAFFLRLER